MKNNMHKLLALTLILALTVMAHGQRRSASVSQQQFDVVIKGGTVYNGTGRARHRPGSRTRLH
jgi:hypothetical protein